MPYFMLNYDNNSTSSRMDPPRLWYGGTELGWHTSLLSVAQTLRIMARYNQWHKIPTWYVDTAYQMSDGSHAIWVDSDSNKEVSEIKVQTFRAAFHMAMLYARWLPSKPRVPRSA